MRMLPAPNSIPTPTPAPLATVASWSFEELRNLGAVLAQSGYFADAKEMAQAFAKILAGRELGLGPIASLVGIHIIQGQVSMGANLIAAAIQRSGRYRYRIAHLDRTKCVLEFLEAGKIIGVYEYTLEDAGRAGLAGRENWKRHPRNMLFARAISNGAKLYCPEVFSGSVYTPDELGEVVEGPEEPLLAPVSPPATSSLTAQATSGQRGELEHLLEATHTSLESMLESFGLARLDELTAGQYQTARKKLEHRLLDQQRQAIRHAFTALGFTSDEQSEAFEQRDIASWEAMTPAQAQELLAWLEEQQQQVPAQADAPAG